MKHQRRSGASRSRPLRPPTVAVVVANQLSPFEFSVACEVFGIDRSHLGVPWYKFVVCAADPSPVTTILPGVTVSTPYGLGPLRTADTIVVPVCGVQGEPPRELIAALRRANARGARILSLCTGAFTLAAAGLLDGRPATTHWRHAAVFQERYPTVALDPRVLYVDDGDILTSAGSAASIDLCLHVVRKDFGAEIANEVARGVVVPPHRDGGQAQYVHQPLPVRAQDDQLSDTLTWMAENLDGDLSVDKLARRASMSLRSFARRFSAATGTTPHQWVLNQRVLLAQRLLETSDLPIEMVAHRCGMGTAAGLRQQFQRAVGTSPAAYRRAFKTTMPIGDAASMG
jgi:transcriptional regulator GlxA family with amidase domain